MFINFFSVLLAAISLISYDTIYYWCEFQLPKYEPMFWITNVWFWVSFTPSAIVTCLNWCILLLALKKNNIDNLAIFSLDVFFAICTLGLLCGALLLANMIIGIAYILMAWVLVHWFQIPNIDTSGDTAVSKAL